MARTVELLYPLAWQLYKKTEWPNRVAVARAMQHHPATLQPWLDHLEHHRALVQTGKSIHVDRNRLLVVLTAHRVAAQRPAASFKTTHADPQEISRLLTKKGVAHVFCLFTAANLLAFYEPLKDVFLYVNRRDIGTVRETLQSDDGSHHVHPLREFTDRVPQKESGGLTITSPFFTVVDLRAHPEGGPHAHFIQQTLLPRLVQR